MRILFYHNKPSLYSTMLNWTLAEEIRLLGHQVYFLDDFPGDWRPKKGEINWVRGGGPTSGDALKTAREIGARCHLHLEGVAYFRISADSALNWGYTEEPSKEVIEKFKADYRSWMKYAYEADSCSVNGANQIKVIQDHLFDGRELPNCHRLACGADARYALSLPKVHQKRNYMVTVSRIAPNKQIMKIAEAIALLDHPLPWVIVGFGDRDYVKMLLKFCKDNNVRVQIKTAFGAEKWYLINNACLMLCGWMGIPPSEGILCDVPVLSYNHPDIIEMYSDSIFWGANNSIYSYSDALNFILEPVNRHDVLQKTWEAKNELLAGGRLYAMTQEQLAQYYVERIFIR
uniref:Putative glycosyltransferase n=1 Tax=viral metagenome TaxID=1070528 RepID=A0A6M3XSS6_9ZZZZ